MCSRPRWVTPDEMPDQLLQSGCEKSAGSPLACDLGEIVFCVQTRRSFPRRWRYAVHEKSHLSVKILPSQTRRLKYDRCLGQHCRRNLNASGQSAFLVAGMALNRRNRDFSESRFGVTRFLSRAKPSGILPGVSRLMTRRAPIPRPLFPRRSMMRLSIFPNLSTPCANSRANAAGHRSLSKALKGLLVRGPDVPHVRTG
jgi:hypothetical protein